MNRLTQKTYPDSTTVNYTYDNDSRLTSVTDPTGTYSFTFDNLSAGYKYSPHPMGRLTGTSTNYSFLTSRSFTTSYTYDKASNRTGFTDPENGSTTYVYDTLNRLQTLTPPSAFTSSGNFGFSYDALSRRTQMTRPNSITTNYSYDNLSRLLSVLHKSGSTTLDGAIYTVDNAANRSSKADQLAGVTSNYSYDPIYELTQVTQGTNTTESYTFDPVGNRTASLGVTSYTTNSSNELTATSNATYTYDYNGNTLTKVVGSNTTSYSWDFENRLSSVTLPGSGGTVSFKYDPFGRRIEKTTSAGTSIYAYDADNLIEETNASGAVVARYTQGEYVDEPLAMLRSSTTSYYQVDGLGSTTSLSNTAGALANTYSYDSFGNLTASTGSLVNPFHFTARDFDAETNLQFSRNRYYDPSGGRFLSEDPIGFGGGSMNFYSYVLNSPTNFIDPSGWRPGDKYPNAKCAGWNAVNDYNPTSIAQNKEYGGFIYQNPDGTFSYTDPHVNKDAGIGNENSIPRFWQIPIPTGTQRGGWYHTHAGGPMSPINSDFSPQDMDISDKSLHGLPGFLGVPNGQVRMYIPNPGNPEHGISFPLSSTNCGCQK